MRHASSDAPVQARRRPPLATILFGVVIFIGIASIVVGYVGFALFAASQQHRADDLRTTVAQKNAIIDTKDSQLADLLDKYAALAQDCQDAADCTTTAPSPEIIQQFIQGTPGEPGHTPTLAETIQAIQDYCSARGDCRGKDGAPGAGGTNGANGADSTVPGPAGPQGTPGADGRGIASTVCDDSGEWQVTYTDGTTQDAGSCRMSLIN